MKQSFRELVERTKQLVAEERKITAQVLEHLRQIEQHKVFAEWGYPSLFEFCVKELGYSESAAQRRISSMRLMREIPELKLAIEEGELSLTAISQVQQLFREKNYTTEDKREILKTLHGKTTREVEQLLATIHPRKPRERNRILNDKHVEVTVVLDQKLLQQIQDHFSHVKPGATVSELIELMAKKVLKSPPAPAVAPQTKAPQKRFIPSAVKRFVQNRDRSCTYTSPEGKRCSSTYLLQFDHIHPFALGGPTIADNLRLRCAAHNRWSAAKQSYAEKNSWVGKRTYDASTRKLTLRFFDRADSEIPSARGLFLP